MLLQKSFLFQLRKKSWLFSFGSLLLLRHLNKNIHISMISIFRDKEKEEGIMCGAPINNQLDS